jgi:hypothetical protein
MTTAKPVDTAGIFALTDFLDSTLLAPRIPWHACCGRGYVIGPGLGFGPGCNNLCLGSSPPGLNLSSCLLARAAAARAQKSMSVVTRTMAFPAADVYEVRGLRCRARPWSEPCRLSPSTPTATNMWLRAPPRPNASLTRPAGVLRSPGPLPRCIEDGDVGE